MPALRAGPEPEEPCGGGSAFSYSIWLEIAYIRFLFCFVLIKSFLIIAYLFFFFFLEEREKVTKEQDTDRSNSNKSSVLSPHLPISSYTSGVSFLLLSPGIAIQSHSHETYSLRCPEPFCKNNGLF